MEEYLDIGKIINTHGIKGEVKVYPLTDDPMRYKKLKKVIIEQNGELKYFHIENIKFFKNLLIIKFQELCSMNDAEKLKNTFIKIERKDAVKLPENSYFICDLVGSEVFEITGELLGKMVDVIKTGSNDVYVVKGIDSKELLIPALKSVVKEINTEKKTITVKLPEGLL